jgi:hypothetical protein
MRGLDQRIHDASQLATPFHGLPGRQACAACRELAAGPVMREEAKLLFRNIIARRALARHADDMAVAYSFSRPFTRKGDKHVQGL